MTSILGTYSPLFGVTNVVPCGWMLGQAILRGNVSALAVRCVS